MKDGVRFATTPEEKSASYRLRYQVYVEEMNRFTERADHAARELRDAYDESARALIGISEGEPVATLRCYWGGDAAFPDEIRTVYMLDRFVDIVSYSQMLVVERMMVPKDRRGAGRLSAQLYNALYQFIVDVGVELVFLDSEPHLINNWLKLGFRPFAPTTTYGGVGLVVPLVGVVWDKAHLAKVGSPLLMTLRDANAEDNHEEVVERVLKRLPELAPLVSERASGAGCVMTTVYESMTDANRDRPFIFDDMREDEVQTVLERSHVIRCSKGDYIIQEGNTAQTLFVLLSGVAEVRRDNDLIAVLTPGAVMGEVAFLLGRPRTADVVAATDEVQVLSLNEGSIRRHIRTDPELSSKLLLNLCKCLCARVL